MPLHPNLERIIRRAVRRHHWAAVWTRVRELLSLS